MTRNRPTEKIGDEFIEFMQFPLIKPFKKKIKKNGGFRSGEVSPLTTSSTGLPVNLLNIWCN